MSAGASSQSETGGLNLFRNAHNLDVQNVEARVAGGNMISQAAPVFINYNLVVPQGDPPTLPISEACPQDTPGSVKGLGGRSTLVRIVLNVKELLNPLKGRPGMNPLPGPSNSKVGEEKTAACTSEFTVVPMGSPDDPSAITKRTSISKGEAYVLSMLLSGKGLACWQPKPQHPIQTDRGVMPGDVGIFGVQEGFQKIFNMWDDEDEIRATAAIHFCDARYEIPTKSANIVCEEAHAEGDTLVQGTTSKTFYHPDGEGITGFEFRYLDPHQKGGILAFTSSTMTEKLPPSEQLMISNRITRHAELLYRHASARHPMPDDEGLYFVTGCMKSDSWALAGFSDPMVSPDNVLKLIRRPDDISRTQTGASRRYVWTDKGTADGYSGVSAASGLQNQCLFLQGFKLGFSQSFLSRVKSPEPSYPGESGSGPHKYDSSGPPNNDGSGSGSGKVGGKGVQFSSIFSRSKSNNEPGNVDFEVTSFPNNDTSICHHPCDVINRYLLEESGLEFALCHDEDWIPLLQANRHEVEVNEGTPSSGGEAISPSDYITAIDGVAVILTPEGEGLRVENQVSTFQDDSQTEITTPRPPAPPPLRGRVNEYIKGGPASENAILGTSTDGSNPSPDPLSPDAGSRPATDSSQQYPSNAANAPHTVAMAPPPEGERVCQECVTRDASMADVDVTSPGQWDRASDADFEAFRKSDSEQGTSANGSRPHERGHPYKSVRLTEQNLAFWASINPRCSVFRWERVSSYVNSQRSLLDAETLVQADALEKVDLDLPGSLPIDGAFESKVQGSASVIGIVPTPVEEAQESGKRSPPPPSPNAHNIAYSESQPESCEPDIFEDNTMLRHFSRRRESRNQRRALSQGSLTIASVVSVGSCRHFYSKAASDLGAVSWVC